VFSLSTHQTEPFAGQRRSRNAECIVLCAALEANLDKVPGEGINLSALSVQVNDIVASFFVTVTPNSREPTALPTALPCSLKSDTFWP